MGLSPRMWFAGPAEPRNLSPGEQSQFLGQHLGVSVQKQERPTRAARQDCAKVDSARAWQSISCGIGTRENAASAEMPGCAIRVVAMSC
jgi:hypothetical protein